MPDIEVGEAMTIVLATDRKFVELAGVLIRSICALGNVPEAKIVVFSDRLRAIDKARLQACADRRLEIVDAGDIIRGQFGDLRITYDLPPVAYMRLLAPDLVSAQGRMLYLDSDTLVNGDLAPLFAIDLKGAPIAAARRTAGPGFNSGVLLIDLDAWRHERIGAKALVCARENPREFHDQEALNAVITERFHLLDNRWNLRPKQAKEFASAFIIHFIGTKPNSEECKNPARFLFLEHRAHTPWAKSLTEAMMVRLWRKIRSLPRRINAAFLQPARR